MIFNKNLSCKLRKGGFRRALFIRQICKGCVCSDEDFVCEAGAEAEAGDEVIEAVGVEKVGGEREVLFEVCPLFFGERSGQLGLKVALFLRELLNAAARSDSALAG